MRKTTLDEAPKLFQLATLCTLMALLAGRLSSRARPRRKEALFLWVALAALLSCSPAPRRGCRAVVGPPERCLFIGDERSAAMFAAKLSGHGGSRRKSSPSWSSARSPPGRPTLLGFPPGEIRDLAQTLDVQRAIVAPAGAPTRTPRRRSTSCAR